MQQQQLFDCAPVMPERPSARARRIGGFGKKTKGAVGFLRYDFDAYQAKQLQARLDGSALPLMPAGLISFDTQPEDECIPDHKEGSRLHASEEYVIWLHRFMFDDALKVLAIDPFVATDDQLRDALANLQWIFTDDVEGVPATRIPFSFACCCIAAEFDIERVRQDMLQMSTVRYILSMLGYKLPKRNKRFFDTLPVKENDLGDLVSSYKLNLVASHEQRLVHSN